MNYSVGVLLFYRYARCTRSVSIGMMCFKLSNNIIVSIGYNVIKTLVWVWFGLQFPQHTMPI